MNRRKLKWPTSRRAKALAVGLALAGVAGVGVTAQAHAADVEMGQGPGRHFFMFVDHDTRFDAEARVLQDGREIVRLPAANLTSKYSEQWTWNGRAGELIQVRLRRHVVNSSPDGTGSDAYGPWESYTLPADMNTCYTRREDGQPMVKVGDSLTGNCTPD